MPTKQNTSEGPAPVKDSRLETMLTRALEQFHAGSLKEAAAAFEALEGEAVKAEAIRLARTAQGYVKAIQARLAAGEAPAPQAEDLTAQIELNHHAPEAALAQVEEGLKDHPGQAGLHYLKAVALAQLDQAQPSADALAKATGLEPGLLFQFRLETDFDGVRHTAPFAAFNRG